MLLTAMPSKLPLHINLQGVLTNMKRYYCLSILDKHHQPDIDFERGLKLLRLCTDELKRRLPIDFKGMLVKVVTKDGIRDVEYEDAHNVPCP